MNNDDKELDSFDLGEEVSKRAGRPPGAVGKKMTNKQMKDLLKGNTKEAILRMVAHMRSEDDSLSFKACCKLLDLGLKMYADDSEMKKVAEELKTELEEMNKNSNVKQFPILKI